MCEHLDEGDAGSSVPEQPDFKFTRRLRTTGLAGPEASSEMAPVTDSVVSGDTPYFGESRGCGQSFPKLSPARGGLI